MVIEIRQKIFSSFVPKVVLLNHWSLGALGSLWVEDYFMEESLANRGIRQDPGPRGSYKWRAGSQQVALISWKGH